MPQQVSKQTKTIMKYTYQGMSAKDIAKKLHLSTQYVHNVRYRERKKAGVSAGITSVKHTGKSETGISSSRPANAKPKATAKPRLEPNVGTDYQEVIGLAKDKKPSLWTRIKRVLGWQ